MIEYFERDAERPRTQGILKKLGLKPRDIIRDNERRDMDLE